jgi:hypothetical protein
MITKHSRVVIFLLMGSLLVPTLAAHAAGFSGSIVPSQCTNCPADYGCVLQLIQSLMNFLVYFATIIMTLLFAMAGFEYMTSGGNPEKRSQANRRILNVFIGLIIVFAAWLIVDSVMKVLYNPDAASGSVKFGPWNQLLKADGAGNCILPRAEPPSLPSIAGNNAGGGTVGSTPSPVTGASGGSSRASAAAAYARAHAAPGSRGFCAIYVREALAAGGYTSFGTNHPAAAYEYGPYLTAQGFSPISSGGAPQVGDVVVFQPISGHPSGHIAIYDGSNWVSDFVQQTMYANKAYIGNSYTIYRSN